MKPYLIHRDNGDYTISHPSFGANIGIPSQKFLTKAIVKDIVNNMILCDLPQKEMTEIKAEIINIILDVWEKSTLPSIKIIRS